MKESDDGDGRQLHSRSSRFKLLPFPKCDFERGLWFGFTQSLLNLTRSELRDSNIHETSHLVLPALHKSLTLQVSCASANGCHLEVCNNSLYVARIQHFPCRKATLQSKKKAPFIQLFLSDDWSIQPDMVSPCFRTFYSHFYTIKPIFSCVKCENTIIWRC